MGRHVKREEQIAALSYSCCNKFLGSCGLATTTFEPLVIPAKAYKAYLFDLDGTLLDSDPLHAAVFVDFLNTRGVDFGLEDYATRIHGRQNVEVFGELLPFEDARALDRAKEAAYRARLGSDLTATPGLTDLLDRARAEGLKCALVTNACRENVDAVLDALGLEDAFDTQSLGDDCPQGKPHPDPYFRALAALGVAAEEAIAFEDSPAGIAAATTAGIPTVGIATGLSPDRLLGLGATLAIADFTDPRLAALIAEPQGATP